MINFKKQYLFILAIFVFIGTNAATYHVNSTTGNDAFNGLSPTYISGLIGPKKTIGNALTLANNTVPDNISIAGGYYGENLVVTKPVNFSIFYSNATAIATIYKLEIKASGKKLNISGSAHITNGLKLTAGIIDVSSATEFRLKAGGTLTGGSFGSYIDGIFHRGCKLTSAKYRFPVGNGKDYRPVSLNISQTNTALNVYKVSVSNTAFPVSNKPSNINRVSLVRYWNIGQTANNVKNLGVNISYHTKTLSDEVYTPQYLRVVKVNGSKWDNLGGIGTKKSIGTITTTKANKTGGFYTLANEKGGRNTLGNQGPIAAFAALGKCSNKKVIFTDSSFSKLGTINKYYWNFGDPSTTKDFATTQHASYTYPGTGPYTATLRVEDSKGKVDVFTKIITLFANPVARFDGPAICLGNATLFRNRSTIISGSITKYEWAFGNGDVSNSFQPKYTYPNAGLYDVSLKVVSDKGCFDVLKRKLIVFDKPKAEFSSARTCIGDQTLFNDKSTSTKSKINYWEYNVESKGKFVGKNIRASFNAVKNYRVTHIVANDKKCRDTVSKIIRIYENPKAQFTLDLLKHHKRDSIQCFKTNQFYIKNTTKKPAGQIIGSTWINDKGHKKIQKDIDVSFKKAGKHKLKLVVRTNNGCRDSLTKVLGVRERIIPNYRVRFLCFGQLTLFEDLTRVNLPRRIVRREWDLGNGQTDFSRFPEVKYSNKGSYKTRMIVSTGYCSDTLEKTITIGSPPKANIKYTPDSVFCNGGTVRVDISGATSYKWFDGKIRVFRTFDKSGIYTFSASDPSGCKTDTSIYLRMRDKVAIQLSNDTTIAKGRRITVKVNAEPGVKLKWYPTTYLPNDTSFNPNMRPLKDIKYVVTATDKNGCNNSDSISIYLTDPDLVKINNIITPDGDGKNDVWDISEVPFSESCHAQVYDTWGNLVFEAVNYNSQWDGTYKGKPLPEGSYMYIINCSAEGRNFKGILHIIK